MSMTYPEIVQAAIRRALLELLAELPDYTLPEGDLAALMHERYPYRLGGVAMAAQTAWLHQAGLATRLAVGATAIVTLTARGLDVARGLETMPGVARRAPGG